MQFHKSKTLQRLNYRRLRFRASLLDLRIRARIRWLLWRCGYRGEGFVFIGINEPISSEGVSYVSHNWSVTLGEPSTFEHLEGRISLEGFRHRWRESGQQIVQHGLEGECYLAYQMGPKLSDGRMSYVECLLWLPETVEGKLYLRFTRELQRFWLMARPKANVLVA